MNDVLRTNKEITAEYTNHAMNLGDLVLKRAQHYSQITSLQAKMDELVKKMNDLCNEKQAPENKEVENG